MSGSFVESWGPVRLANIGINRFISQNESITTLAEGHHPK